MLDSDYGIRDKGFKSYQQNCKKKQKKNSCVLKLHKPQKNVTYIKAPTSWNSREFK